MSDALNHFTAAAESSQKNNKRSYIKWPTNKQKMNASKMFLLDRHPYLRAKSEVSSPCWCTHDIENLLHLHAAMSITYGASQKNYMLHALYDRRNHMFFIFLEATLNISLRELILIGVRVPIVKENCWYNVTREVWILHILEKGAKVGT